MRARVVVYVALGAFACAHSGCGETREDVAQVSSHRSDSGWRAQLLPVMDVWHRQWPSVELGPADIERMHERLAGNLESLPALLTGSVLSPSERDRLERGVRVAPASWLIPLAASAAILTNESLGHVDSRELIVAIVNYCELLGFHPETRLSTPARADQFRALLEEWGDWVVEFLRNPEALAEALHKYGHTDLMPWTEDAAAAAGDLGAPAHILTLSETYSFAVWNEPGSAGSFFGMRERSSTQWVVRLPAGSSTLAAAWVAEEAPDCLGYLGWRVRLRARGSPTPQTAYVYLRPDASLWFWFEWHD